MARNLTTLTITAPSSDPNANEGTQFSFTVTPGFGGNGGVTAYDLDFQWDQGTDTWVSIASTGGLATSDTNPISSTTSDVGTTITVDANTAGSYNIRVVNTSRSVTSGTQAVTVVGATINDKTLQDLDSVPMDQEPTRRRLQTTVTEGITALDTVVAEVIDSGAAIINEKTTSDDAAVTDAIEAERLRRVVLSESIGVADTAGRVPQVVDRTLTDDIALDFSQTLNWFVARWTPVELLNVYDHAEHEVVPAGGSAIYNETLSDSIAVTDGTEPERIQRVQLADDTDVAEALLVERSVDRLLADSIEADDTAIASAAIVNAETLADELDVADALVAERSVDRTLTDDADVADALVAERAIDRLLADDADVTDALVAERRIDRTLTDDITAEDTPVAEFVPGANINQVTLSDAVELTDAPDKRLHIDREKLESVLMDQLPVRRRLVAQILDAFDQVTDTAIATLVTEAVNALVAEDSVPAVEDLLFAERLITRALAESVTVTDTAIVEGAGIIEKTLTDELAVTDAAQLYVLRLFDQILADSLATDDYIEIQRQRLRLAAESIALTENRLTSRSVILSDSIDTDDATVVTLVSEGITYNRETLDSVTVADTIAAARSLHLVRYTSVDVTDAMLSSALRPRVLVDSDIELTDATLTAIRRVVARLLTDTTDVAETVVAGRALRVTDVVALSENVLHAVISSSESTVTDITTARDAIVAARIPWSQVEVYILLDVIDSGEEAA